MSNIDPSKPEEKQATTLSVRDNFQAAADEIDALIAENAAQQITIDANAAATGANASAISTNAGNISDNADDITALQGQPAAKARVYLGRFTYDEIALFHDFVIPPGADPKTIWVQSYDVDNFGGGGDLAIQLITASGLIVTNYSASYAVFNDIAITLETIGFPIGNLNASKSNIHATLIQTRGSPNREWAISGAAADDITNQMGVAAGFLLTMPDEEIIGVRVGVINNVNAPRNDVSCAYQ